ncbi:MAG: sugar phosphate isomerase/epimerase [Planctomycetes bacterium]|nr:sugar phosphate isomerase/epimerase [Planctomycetota bacterium]
MESTRRELLRSAMAAGAAAAFGACASRSLEPDRASAPAFRISLAQWSLHRSLHAKTLDPLDFPVVARRQFDIGGVEYVNSFYGGRAKDHSYLRELRKRCSDHGVESLLIMCDGEGSLGDANAAERANAVENHKKWIEAAQFLGCKSIRVNAYGSGPPEDHAAAAADSLTKLADWNGHDLNILVENHGGLSSNGAWLAGVMRRAGHPRVGTLPDFGNFRIAEGHAYDRYLGVSELMPFAKAVSAKSYAFNASGDETTIDYARMIQIVLGAGYRAWIGVEYEGDAHSESEGIQLTKALLERLRPGQI